MFRFSLSSWFKTDESLLRFCSIINWAIGFGFILAILFIWIGWAGPWILFVVGLMLLVFMSWLFYLGFDTVHHKTVRVIEVLGRKISSTYRSDGPCFMTPFLESPIADVSLKKRQWRIFTASDDPEAKTQEMRDAKITISEAYVFVQPKLYKGKPYDDFPHQMVYAFEDVPKIAGKGEAAAQRIICDHTETIIRALCATYYLDEALSGGKIGFNPLGRITISAKLLTGQKISPKKEGINKEELAVLKERMEELSLEEKESIIHAAAHVRSVEKILDELYLEFSKPAIDITNFELSETTAKARDQLHTRQKEAEAAEYIADRKSTELAGTLVLSLSKMTGKSEDEIRGKFANANSKLGKMAYELLPELTKQQMSLDGNALQHIKVDGAEAFLAKLAFLFGGANVTKERGGGDESS